MKKMMWGVLSLFLLTVSCSKDNTEIITDPSTPKLVTPQLRAFVDSPIDPQIPMTGILEVFPCKTGTSIYFGNYIKVGSINSIFYFLHKAAEPFNCLEQDNLTQS